MKEAHRKQVITTVQPHAPPRCEPTLEVARILMVDFTSTPPQAKEVAPPTSCERVRLLPLRPNL
jgi:hypothetical protein